MGFDLYGSNPVAEDGKYFRNSVWGWHPLADYVMAVCDDLLQPDEREYWHSNDGMRVSEATAKNIAARLQAEIATGRTGRFAARHEQERKALPKHPCKWCGGTGFRDDEVGQSIRENNPSFGCNACGDSGEVDDFDSHYPFDADNVQKFADFCAMSGGFSIC